MCNDEHLPDDLDVVSETNPSPDPLRALLESAASPATTAELGDVEAAVAAFRAGLASPASGTVQGSRAVLLRRVPRRAVGVVVGTLLVAGTAAAAATDVLPSWVPVVGQESTDESVALDDPSTVETGLVDTDGDLDDSDDTDSDSVTDETALIDGTGTPSVASVPEQSSRDWGWCRAWSKGGSDDPVADDGTTVAERLAVLADAEGVTVDEFCAAVLATPPNEKDPGRGKPGSETVSTDDTVVPADPDNPDDTVPPSGTASNGNGKGGGNGNAGNGKGTAPSADTTAP